MKQKTMQALVLRGQGFEHLSMEEVAGRYVAAVLEMIKAGEISGKAILYPQIRPTPLRMVECWSADEERRFLAERS